MKKLKWNYDEERKVYTETTGWFRIEYIIKGVKRYEMEIHYRPSISFKKLSTAKKVAQLIHNG